MSDEKQDQHDEQPEAAYPGHGPSTDGPSPEVDLSDSVEAETGGQTVPGKVVPDGEQAAQDQDDDEQSTDEDGDSDPDPVLPADDSEIHGEPTIQPGATDPNL